MNDNGVFPRTLIETVKHFADPNVAVEFLARIRWPKGPACPHCGSKKICFLKTRRVFKCTTRPCRKQFSIKVGTIFEDSAVGLDKWLPAVWMIANCKNGISSWELHRALGVTQKTAWFMLHRIRLAMQSGTFEKLSGKVEADETFIGGKARFMHADKRKEKIHGRGAIGKAVVLGMLERRGEVKAVVVKDRKKKTLQPYIKAVVEKGSELHTDDLKSYEGLDEYIHEVINHAEEYVRGDVHTNGMENFWSLLKRGLKGTYVSVEPFHLFRYLDEQVFRFNARHGVDFDRFCAVLRNVVGRRLTYSQATGTT